MRGIEKKVQSPNQASTVTDGYETLYVVRLEFQETRAA